MNNIFICGFLKEMFSKPMVMWTFVEELVFICGFCLILGLGALLVYVIACIYDKISKFKLKRKEKKKQRGE